MNNSDVRFNRRLSWLVAGSLLMFVATTVISLSHGSLPYGTPDSAGHPVGFNERLYPEHYLMMARNFRLTPFFESKHVYEWVLLAMHLAGLGLLLAGSKVSTRLTRWFFALQPLVFPWGFPLLPVVAWLILNPNDHLDIEFWSDVPATMFLVPPIWVWTSLFVVWQLRGERLGLKRLSRWLLRRREEPPAKKKPLGAAGIEGSGQMNCQSLA